MRIPILSRKWESLIVLSIVVPVGLMVSFRLTGILTGPEGPVTIAETITLETIEWEVERPKAAIKIWDDLESLYEGEINLVHGILVDDFVSRSWTYGGSDYVVLRFNITASASNGHIQGVHLAVAEKTGATARIDIFDSDVSRLEGLSITGLRDWDREVFASLVGMNRPKKVHFWTPIHWVFYSPYNQNHVMEVTSELTYYNGSAYKKIVQLFQLKIGPDNNNGFETAQEIHEGYYPRLYIGKGAAEDITDVSDYYKIYVPEGGNVKVYANGTAWSWPILPNPSPFFGLHLYDPEQNLIVSKEQVGDFQTIDFVANSTGFWFIEVRIDGSFGFYSLTISLGDNQ